MVVQVLVVRRIKQFLFIVLILFTLDTAPYRTLVLYSRLYTIT